MKCVKEIKRFTRWNGITDGGEVDGMYIWDWQFDAVVKDYKKQGFKVKIQDIKK